MRGACFALVLILMTEIVVRQEPITSFTAALKFGNTKFVGYIYIMGYSV
jgi:hypothetical protein